MTTEGMLGVGLVGLRRYCLTGLDGDVRSGDHLLITSRKSFYDTRTVDSVISAAIVLQTGLMS